jgi:hypothetical protein
MPAPPRGLRNLILTPKRKNSGALGAKLGHPRSDHRHRQECLCHTSTAKKLRYMSKFAVIFFRSDNTHLNCTQPIANLLMVRLEVFQVYCLHLFEAQIVIRHGQCPISLLIRTRKMD